MKGLKNKVQTLKTYKRKGKENVCCGAFRSATFRQTTIIIVNLSLEAFFGGRLGSCWIRRLAQPYPDPQKPPAMFTPLKKEQ